ncbi:hypothetical protein RB195_008470 [Necator americanus]|uniref:7TM GPCR serpentine receptor class x (Srx) domain-containing protein n=1 Tax=Necator americanus TaxID=51031 RepID=A0ABR1CQP5_NECAM
MGALMDASWCSMALATVLLTLHRLTWTVFPFRAKRILPHNISQMFALMLWTFYGAMLAINLTPYSAMRFRKDWISWYYDRDLPFSTFFLHLHIVCTYASVIVSTLVYIVVFAVLLQGQSQARKLREMRMTLLVFSFCAYQIVCFIIWEFVLPALDYNYYVSFVSLIMWVIWNGASAILYMMFSVSFRRDLKKLILSTGCCGSGITVNVVLPASPRIETPRRATMID